MNTIMAAWLSEQRLHELRRERRVALLRRYAKQDKKQGTQTLRETVTIEDIKPLPKA
jgi:hypothetical protein